MRVSGGTLGSWIICAFVALASLGGVKFEAIEVIESGQAEEELAWLLGEECAMPVKST